MYKDNSLRLLLTAIVATDENGAIGKGNTIPWDSPTDMRHFMHQTMGGVCIVGSKTFNSFKRPLPGRRMIVLTRTPDIYTSVRDTYFVGSVEQALSLADKLTFGGKAWVIGGKEIYTLFAPYTKRVLHSTIEGCVVDAADTFFDWSIYDDSVEIVPFYFALRDKITKWQHEFLDKLVKDYGHQVFHCKKYTGTNGKYIGRPTEFKNRFTHLPLDKVTGNDVVKVATRELAVITFLDEMNKKISENSVATINHLRKLKGKDLLCWCSNGTDAVSKGAKYCHGHVYAYLIDRYVK